MHRCLLFGLAAVCTLTAMVWVWLARDTRGFDLMALHDELRTRFDPQFPGRGVADYPGNTIEDVPKAYAMVLKAELLLMGNNNRPNLVEPAGLFLISHEDERGDGFAGWGVPVAWDAYGDGSVNPAHTKYTISTAIVADALLDWIEADPRSPRHKILALIRNALKQYLDVSTLSPSGLLPYSLEAADRPYDTFNPAGYLAGVMQRYSHLEPDADLQKKLREIADRTVAVHLAHKQVGPDGSWYWRYSITEKVPNDLAHAAYIAHGLRLYAEHGGRLAGSLNLVAIEQHLYDFVEPSSRRILAWPRFRADTNSPARSYDLGIGLYLVCQRLKEPLSSDYVAALPAYRSPAGQYFKYPSRLGQLDLAVREYEAYLLLGMSSCLSVSRT